MARHDIALGKQPNRVMRDRWRARPVPERGPWEHVEWWLQRASVLPALECGKSAMHGAATTYFHADRMGKALGYRCNVCGWRKVVLVQDGPAEPAAPETEVKLSNHQLAALGKTDEARRAGARVRAENVAKFGVKRRRSWWDDRGESEDE